MQSELHDDNIGSCLPEQGGLQVLPTEIIRDLAVRFILNLPHSDNDSWERVMSHVEEAYYFYCDQIVPVANEFAESENSYHSDQGSLSHKQHTFMGDAPPQTLSLAEHRTLRAADIVAGIHAKYTARSKVSCADLFPYLSFESFTAQIFSRILHLSLEDIIKGLHVFSSYKNTVNVCGVVLMNPGRTHIIGVSARKHSRLYFPKGKIMKNESDYECALREAREEIGVDLSRYLAASPIVSKHHKNFPPYRFFAAIGPWESTSAEQFVPQCKGEIHEVRWIDIDLLRIEYFRRGIARRLRQKHASGDAISQDDLLQQIENETSVLRKDCPFDHQRLSWMANYYEEICIIKSR
ncbi:mRNA-decapping enzyme subunit 2 [Perkinsela sp. CCAP 1560/4]|nr:mRNA-decapping enzyme subunit 2 [Perkinsela sp. CCAP 1560/4]|eukprot:KNH00552.1 mRNA-decapping enzyme subunit 2 [Perkinsela sp. CCAP 1560/4]